MNSVLLNTFAPASNLVYLPVMQAPDANTLPFAYYDDFSDTTSGWYSADQSQVRWSYRANEYEILLRSSDYWAGVTRGLVLPKDVAVEADMYLRAGSGGRYGMVFGFTNSYNFSVFLVDPTTRSYSVWQYASAFKEVIPWTVSPDIRAGSATNRLRIERVEPGLAVYRLLINGQQQTAFRSTNLSRGVGLFAESPPTGSAPAVLRYDNFRVEQIVSAASASASAIDSEAEELPAISGALCPEC